MTAMKITIGAGMPTVSAVDQDQHSNLLGPVLGDGDRERLDLNAWLPRRVFALAMIAIPSLAPLGSRS